MIVNSLNYLNYNIHCFQERLEREYNLTLITTAPSVVYRVDCINGDTVNSVFLQPLLVKCTSFILICLLFATNVV